MIVLATGTGPFGEAKHRRLDDQELVRVESRQEVLVDPVQVRPRGGSQPAQALGREDSLRAARVGEARVPLHQAVGDEAIDEPGDTALAEEHPVGQLAHPDPPAGRLGDREQGVVLGERQVVLGAKLLVEATRDPGVRAQERPPRFEAGIAGVRGRTTGSVMAMAGCYTLLGSGVVDNATIEAYRCEVNYLRQATNRSHGPTHANTSDPEEPDPMSTWQLDPAHTQVNFSAKHMMVTTVRGTFHDVQGTIELDEDDPTRSHGEFRVATASVDTSFGARDTHLRSADFFDAERYPAITFVSTAVESVRGNDYRVTGDLTIRDVTQARDVRRRARRASSRACAAAATRASRPRRSSCATTGA